MPVLLDDKIILLNPLTSHSRHEYEIVGPLLFTGKSEYFAGSCQTDRKSTFSNFIVLTGAAIDFLHSQRIIHRDLKPENVVIKHEGNKVYLHLHFIFCMFARCTCESIVHGSCLNPVTPKGDQFQISAAASQEILHHTVCRTWFSIAYSDER